MNDVAGKSAFHKPPAPSPSRPALTAPERPRPVVMAAKSKGLDQRVIWLAGAAGVFIIAWVALGAAVAFIFVFASGLGWLLHERRRQSAKTTRPTTPSRKAGWALIGLLVALAAVFFWNSARIAGDLSSPAARKLAEISTNSTLMSYAPHQAAAGLGTLDSMRRASDLSLWLGVGAIGLAILGGIVMVASSNYAASGQSVADQTLILLPLCLGLALLSGCSRADLVGSIYGRTEGGDVKRAADVEVLLVPRSDALERQFAEMEGAFEREMAPARIAYEDAQRAASDASRLEREAIRSASYPDLSLDRATARSRSRRQWDAAGEAARTLDGIRQRYRDQAMGLLRQSGASSVRTDANGAFEFDAVETGRYWVVASWDVRRVEVIFNTPTTFTDRFQWFIPIDLTSGENKFQLTTNNAGWAFSR